MSEPVLRVISGDPSPEELAAVLAVVLRPQATVVEPEPASQWNDRSHALRTPLTPGPHAWRASARS